MFLSTFLYHFRYIIINRSETMNYAKYDKHTQRYMAQIEEYIKHEYKEVPEQWALILNLLADNIALYLQCRESINKNGIYNSETGRKNGLLSTMKDILAQVLKMISHLGISPYSVSKIKLGEEDDTEDYIENLTK